MIQDEEYTYDAVGNRLTSVKTQNDWTYNQNNELETSDNTTYAYDSNGNMIRKTESNIVTNYIYNEEDRLKEVRDGSDTLIASYYYDPFGRRLWKEVSGVKTFFVYADEGLVGEYDATGAEIRSYGYTPSSTWTTDPLFMKENGTYYFYQNDHLGTPQKLTGSNGAIVWSATYESFGKAAVEIEAVENNLRFPGQYYDNETGLHYNLNRYYCPQIGRYLRVDPSLTLNPNLHISFRLLWDLAVPQELNYFAYVNNNSIKFMDPTGLAVWACNRKTNWGVGNHAYLWDDRDKTCCGMGSTKKCKERGPGKDACNKVEGSDGKENQIMKCCRDTADKGLWFPPINDCHEAIDDCIKAADLKNPGAPGGRIGPPCDPCDEK